MKRDLEENQSCSLPSLMVPIVKIVGDLCNLRCSYCFYNSKEQGLRQLMSLELLERLISQYAQIFSNRAQFIWHGGEPLLAGISFFEEIVDLQRRYFKERAVIENCVQTNGTLLNRKWAEFFKANNFQISISLDGCEENHNHFRKYADGTGTFPKVLNGLKILRTYGIEPGLIQVITRDSLQYSQQNFQFLADSLRIRSWSFIPFYNKDRFNPMRIQSLSNSKLTRFLKTYIDCWFDRDNPCLRIVDIEDFLCGIWGKRASLCSFNGCCEEFFCVDWDGKIYPCDGYLSNSPDLAIGDLSRQSLRDMLQGRLWREFIKKAKTAPRECLRCQWYEACHNGCPSYRVGGINGKYYFCEMRKKIFSYLADIVSKQGIPCMLDKVNKKKGGRGDEGRKSLKRCFQGDKGSAEYSFLQKEPAHSDASAI